MKNSMEVSCVCVCVCVLDQDTGNDDSVSLLGAGLLNLLLVGVCGPSLSGVCSGQVTPDT